MRWSTQCVAVRCSVLQCVAVCCSVSPHRRPPDYDASAALHLWALLVFVLCSLLQSVAVCCSLLQSVAVCCRVLHRRCGGLQCECCTASSGLAHIRLVQCVAAGCSLLPYVAVCCSVLQCRTICHAVHLRRCACTHTQIYTHTNAHTHKHAHVRIHTYTYIYTYIHTNIHVYIRPLVCVNC